MFEIESIIFESKDPLHGFTVKASYLKKPNNGDALVEMFKEGEKIREFIFPAYKIWNIAAHWKDIVDSELASNTHGYELAASTGFLLILTP
jgi:hypothetical protein